MQSDDEQWGHWSQGPQSDHGETTTAAVPVSRREARRARQNAQSVGDQPHDPIPIAAIPQQHRPDDLSSRHEPPRRARHSSDQPGSTIEPVADVAAEHELAPQVGPAPHDDPDCPLFGPARTEPSEAPDEPSFAEEFHQNNDPASPSDSHFEPRNTMSAEYQDNPGYQHHLAATEGAELPQRGHGAKEAPAFQQIFASPSNDAPPAQPPATLSPEAFSNPAAHSAPTPPPAQPAAPQLPPQAGQPDATFSAQHHAPGPHQGNAGHAGAAVPVSPLPGSGAPASAGAQVPLPPGVGTQAAQGGPAGGNQPGSAGAPFGQGNNYAGGQQPPVHQQPAAATAPAAPALAVQQSQVPPQSGPATQGQPAAATPWAQALAGGPTQAAPAPAAPTQSAPVPPVGVQAPPAPPVPAPGAQTTQAKSAPPLPIAPEYLPDDQAAAAPKPAPGVAPPAPARAAATSGENSRTDLVTTSSEFRLHDVMTEMVAAGASDLHLSLGLPPMMRVSGGLQNMPGHGELTAELLQKTIYQMMTQKQRERFENDLELDFSYALPSVGRFRVNIYRQREALGAALRIIPFEIKSLEQLGMPAVLGRFAALPRGLVLVTGPTGSGKSTTLAGIIDQANETRHDHIMTVEDPIEFLHKHKKCMVNQREVGADTMSFAAALKHALRQDPDIILVGEMRDLETISVALTAAETGHLVFGTLHTQDAAQTIDRVIDVFPPEQQQQVRVMLAGSLQGVVCQTLCKTADNQGRVAATEVLLANPAVRNLIREGKTHQIYTAMQAGAKEGMHTMDASLAELTRAGKITAEMGLEKCHHVEDYKRLTGRA